jgi:hypothetical protein
MEVSNGRIADDLSAKPGFHCGSLSEQLSNQSQRGRSGVAEPYVARFALVLPIAGTGGEP